MELSSDENSSNDEKRRAAVCFVLIGAALKNESCLGEENNANGWQSCVALDTTKGCMKILFRN